MQSCQRLGQATTQGRKSFPLKPTAIVGCGDGQPNRVYRLQRSSFCVFCYILSALLLYKNIQVKKCRAEELRKDVSGFVGKRLAIKLQWGRGGWLTGLVLHCTASQICYGMVCKPGMAAD